MADGRVPALAGRGIMKRLEWTLVSLVLAHLAVVVVHTIAHVALRVVPGPADAAFIVGVIMIGPVVALPFLRLHRLLAAGLLVVAMVAAFAYGFQGHFLAPGPDNVAIVAADSWTLVYVLTGVVLGALEVLTAIAAAALFARTVRTPSAPGGPSG